MVATGCVAACACWCWSILFKQADLRLFSELPGLYRTRIMPAGHLASHFFIYFCGSKPISLPIPWRLAVPSTKELLIALSGAITLIGSNVVGATFIQYLNAHSWQVTSFPLPTSSVLQYFDGTVGMIFVGLSEEACFRFYLINLLLLRGMSRASAIVVSTLIFAGIHWSYGAGAVVFAMLAGLVLSSVFTSTRNLIAPIITHAAFDAVYFAGGIALLWRLCGCAW